MGVEPRGHPPVLGPGLLIVLLELLDLHLGEALPGMAYDT